MCLSYRVAKAGAVTEQLKPGFMCTPSSDVSVSTARPSSSPAPAIPPVSFAVFDPALFKEVSPQKPQLDPENLGKLPPYIIILKNFLLIKSVCSTLHQKALWSEVTPTLSLVLLIKSIRFTLA